MRKLIIGFSTPKEFKLASFLIRKFERAEYSHIFIKMAGSPASKLPFDKVFQASHGDVNAIKFDNFKEYNEIIHEYEIEVSDEDYFKIANFLWDQLGKDYGFWQLVGIATGLHLGDNDDSAYICSELAAMVLQSIGIEFNEDSDYIGLNDVKSVLDKQGL